MSKISFIILLFLLVLVFCFSQDAARVKDPQRFYQLYKDADRAFSDAEKFANTKNYTEEKEDALNREALQLFRNLLLQMEQSKFDDDSLIFHCYYKLGVLEHYFNNLPAARKAYRSAIKIHEASGRIPDTFLFRPQLYYGIILYSDNQFDSAIAAYKKAASIADTSSTLLQGTERLYNTLGTIYYETGNYRQAKNYFQKSMAILQPAHPYYRDLLVNYQINLASTHNKLEEYEAALSLYHAALPHASSFARNAILHNTGVIHMNLGAVSKAIEYFSQVHYTGPQIIRLLNDKAQVYFNLNQPDSASSFLNKAIAENAKWNGHRKNSAFGQTLKIAGDIAFAQADYQKAAQLYQQAIIQFFNDFNETGIFQNPENYSGVFSYIPLFHTLTAKSEALEQDFRKTKDVVLLEAALNSYQSAFRLTDYVEKTYDSDEARLFLNKIKYMAHSKPIDVSLALYEITKNQQYLEDAYLFDQRNKASILSLNIQQNAGRTVHDENAAFYEQETSLRTAITRLSLKASQVTDSIELREINAAIRDYEIELGKIRDRISRSDAIKNTVDANRIPPVADLQKMLDAKTTLLSYHLSPSEILILVISKNNFSFSKIPITDSFPVMIQSFISHLHHTGSETRYGGTEASKKLYRWLITPVVKNIRKSERLVIIPDDELNYIPFEALQDEDGRYLAKNFSIQYQYTTALLPPAGKKLPGHDVLSFAPFASTGFSGGSFSFSALPYSNEEVAGLPGKLLSNADATKNNFISYASRYPVIHLATHASADDADPDLSYIAFYPGNPDSIAAYRLFANEISNLRLDSVRLIILSACETGTGQLVRGEGLMSLSRAFAYAGCPNIITSFWKAEDRTTAFITKKLHEYIDKGYKTDKALQKAKLDLLASPDIDPRLKSPNYWAHLVFIGNFEPDASLSLWRWGLGIGGIILLSFLLYRYRKKNSG